MSQQTVAPPKKGERVKTLYEMINKQIPDSQEREKWYYDIAEGEFKKLTGALDKAIKAKASMLDMWQGLVETGELQEMLGTLFMAAKPEHRETISYLYDKLQEMFGIAQTEIDVQVQKLQQGQRQ